MLLSHFSRVRLCATPETAAHQAPLPGILQAGVLEWGCHALLQGIFPTQGVNTCVSCIGRWVLYRQRHLQGRMLNFILFSV